MITRRDIIEDAIEKCLKEIYSFVQPHIEWDEFMKECKTYSEIYKKWKSERDLNSDYKNKSITECIGPRPYEYYYIPRELLKDICDSYVHAYGFDQQQELLDTIETLKDYCKNPIVDKYIDEYTDKYGNHHPGYRGYDHPDNLEKEIFSILKENSNYWKSAIGESNPSDLSKELQNKFFEFLDMAGKFFNWNRDLSSFNTSVYLGPSPNTNKEAVIENWKKYRNQDIEINEEQIKKDYYGEDELD